MRRLLLAVLFGGCEGQAVLQGEQGPVDGVIGVSGAPKVTVFSCTTSSIEATVPLQCSVSATHPRGSGLSCRLESSSGERLELGDCSSERAAEVRLMTPGAATLRLVVVDDEAQQTERTLQLEVLLPPNQLPRITTFSASRTTGVTPFTSTLTIDASDPDSSDVQCELTPGGSVPCAMGRHQLDVTTRGATTVTLTVRDGRGGVVTQAVTLTGVAPVGDVRVESVQLGQSVISPMLKLVEGKPALVVAQVLSDTPGLGSVVEVIGRRAGVELGRQRLSGPATHATAAVDVSRQYRGTIPAAWVAPGLELVVVADAMDSLPETNEQNNELRSTPAIGRRNVLHLTSVPVVVSGTTSSVPDLKDTMVAQWPLADLQNRTRAPYTTSQVPSGADVSSWGALLSEVAQVRGADGSSRHYYGFVRSSSYGIAGIGYVGQPTAIGRDDNEGVASHELGHNFGRHHAPCGGAGGADPSYPYPNANLGSWGWNGQSLINPAQSVDLMSYCGPTWISDYTYVGAQRALERDQDYGPTPPQAMVLEPSVLVAAVVRGASLQLEPLHVMLAARTRVERSDWSVRLTTTDGAEHQHALRVAKVSDADDEHLLGLVADPGPLRSVELLHHGVVVLRQLAQPVSLSVRVTRVDGQRVRVEWNATAAPTLSVAHFGEGRTTLTLRATGGSIVLAHDGLEGGELELSASSGVASVRQRVPMP
ncbi:MAG: M66 family metalloprotease [Myxococcaceae bacterium]